MERRQFLKLTGCGAVVALVGGGCSLADQADAACPYGMTNDPYPGECRRYVDSNGSGYCDFSEVTATVVPSTTAAAKQAQSSQTTQDEATTLTVLCHRGCRYPGHCSRYVDEDGSGICDLSEGVASDAQSDSGLAGQATAPLGRGRRS